MEKHEIQLFDGWQKVSSQMMTMNEGKSKAFELAKERRRTIRMWAFNVKTNKWEPIGDFRVDGTWQDRFGGVHQASRI